MQGRIFLLGNHSSVHAGCVAVWEFLKAFYQERGFAIVGNIKECDILIVNGEGSMHHDRPTLVSKMSAIESALQAGKRCFLVNTVWDSNSPRFDKTLERIERIFCRDVLSANELLKKHHVPSDISLDLSYFYTGAQARGHRNYEGRAVKTDYLAPHLGNFASLHLDLTADLEEVDMVNVSWRTLIDNLSTASMLITGRHHAVYAACRARIPFAAIEGNSHKIKGLIASAKVDIPVADNIADLPSIVGWAKENDRAYQRLFDWMERQDPEAALPIP